MPARYPRRIPSFNGAALMSLESLAALPESAQRVARLLLELGHDKPVVVLPQTGKTTAEAAAGLGCEVAQIPKSIIFRRAADDAR